MSDAGGMPAMSGSLRVLHLEDSPRDAEMVADKLESEGVVCDTTLTSTKESFEAALMQPAFDLILVDYNLPGYDGLAALRQAQAVQPDTPVILISGTVGEEVAVKCLQIGATDYLLKMRLERLVPAVRRALQGAEVRRAQKRVEAALSESESRKAAILESVLDCIVTMDAEGIVLEFNAAAARTFGYSKAEAIGRPLADLIIPPRFRDRHRDGLARYLASGEGPFIGKVIEIIAMQSDGTEIPVELAITAIRAGSAAVFTGVLRDITARQHADETRARLAAIVDSSDDAIFGMALDYTILTWNAGAERLYGYAAVEMIGQNHGRLVPIERQNELELLMVRAARRDNGEAIETQRVRKDGSIIDISMMISPMVDAAGRVTSVSTIARDITSRKHAEAELNRLSEKIELQRLREFEAAHALSQKMAHFAQYDVLTDLPNRTLLDDRITQAIALAVRQGTRVAVLFVDLDRFKQINDSLGHATGDALLRSVTARLLASVRGSDTVSRYGGDEFVVLLSHLRRPDQAALVADKIISALAEPHEVTDHVLHVTASVGISIFPDDGGESDSLISAADTAMYHAKEGGRNNSQFFTPQMNARRLARRSLEGSLREALQRQEFTLHYQPKFSLTSSRITAVEALVRWQHPSRGLVPPGEFVAVAEECGLIVPLGRWVLREACRQARLWQVAGLRPMPVAVNVSAIEFRARGFLDQVVVVLHDTGLDARYLELELTESVLMADAESTTASLYALKELGIRLALDDFGTGYSSLSYLSRFPIDALKIDRSFVRDMVLAGHDASIIKAVIAMGRSLDLRVVAEGIETAEQLSLLQQWACSEGQGFYFSRPVTADQFATLLQQERPETDAVA